jgi:hypothetical protein
MYNTSFVRATFPSWYMLSRREYGRMLQSDLIPLNRHHLIYNAVRRLTFDMGLLVLLGGIVSDKS